MFLLLPAMGYAQGVSEVKSLESDGQFLRATWLGRVKIAHDVNLLNSLFQFGSIKNQNVIADHDKILDDMEANFYGRMISGMMLISYHYDKTSVSRTIHYNPVYDVLLMAEWDARDINNVVLTKMLFAPGEIIRKEAVTVNSPGWMKEGSVDALVRAYKAVVQNCKDTKCSLGFPEIEKIHRWSPEGGDQDMDDRAVVYQRVMMLGSYVLSHTRSARVDLMPSDMAAGFQAARPAVIAGDNLQRCLQPGAALHDIIRCELEKDRFESVSIPQKVWNDEALGSFLAHTYDEGAIGIGDIGISFVGSPIPMNYFLFIITTVRGKPRGLSLVDLYSQAMQ